MMKKSDNIQQTDHFAFWGLPQAQHNPQKAKRRLLFFVGGYFRNPKTKQ